MRDIVHKAIKVSCAPKPSGSNTIYKKKHVKTAISANLALYSLAALLKQDIDFNTTIRPLYTKSLVGAINNKLPGNFDYKIDSRIENLLKAK